MTKTKNYYLTIASRFGDLAVVWQETGQSVKIVEILLPSEKEPIISRLRRLYGNILRGSAEPVLKLKKKLLAYLAGKQTFFGLSDFDLDKLYTFQRRVLDGCRKIPYGRVISYGDLAKKIGTPRAARAVGTALAKNPFPIVIPCHRVIKGNGLPGKFGGGEELKKDLLKLEGVRFYENSRVMREFIL